MLVPKPISEAVTNAQAATCLILCERWLKDHPTDRWVMYEYAEMLYKLTRYEEAIDVYQQIIANGEEEHEDEDDGGLSSEYCQLGHLYSYRGNLEAAVRWYEQSIQEDPDWERNRTFLSQTLARMGRLEEAEEAIRKAMECKDSLGGTFQQLGLVMRGLSRYDEAATAFRQTLEFWKDDKETLDRLEDVESAANVRAPSLDSIQSSFNDRPATCIALIERYLQEEKGDLRTLLQYAGTLTEVWRHDDAERVYDLLLTRNPSLVVVFQGLGQLCRCRGEMQQAAQWYAKAADEDPDHTASYILGGGALARAGDLKAAEARHRRATKCIRGDFDEAYHNLGLVLRAQDRLGEAAECFRTALGFCDDYEDATLALRDVEAAMSLRADSSV